MLLPSKWTAKHFKAHYELVRRGSLFHLMHSGQLRFFKDVVDASPEKYALLYTARQFGKTEAACYYGVMHCLRQPKRVVRHIFPTFKLAKEVMFPKMGNLIALLPDELKPQFRRAEGEYVFPNGSIYKLGGADASSVDTNRGNYTTLAILDELGFFDAGVFDYLVFSVLLPQTTHYPDAKIIGVTTPPASVTHPVLTSFMPRAQKVGNFQRSTIYDNPLLSKEQIEQLKQDTGGEDSNAWRREYLAEVVQNDSLRVVPEYRPHEHYLDYQLPTHGHAFEPVLGFWGAVIADYGVGTRDYSAVVGVVYDHINSKLVVVKETMVKGQGLADLSRCIKETEQALIQNFNCERVEVVVDIMAQAGLELRNVYMIPYRSPSKIKVIDMIGSFRNAVDHGKIIVHKDCTKTNDTLNTGLWKKSEVSLTFDRTAELGHLDILAALLYGFRACPWRAQDFSNSAVKKGWMTRDLPIKESSLNVTPTYSTDNYASRSTVIRRPRNLVK